MNEFEEIGACPRDARTHRAHWATEHIGRLLVTEPNHLSEHERLTPIAIEFDEQRLHTAVPIGVGAGGQRVTALRAGSRWMTSRAYEQMGTTLSRCSRANLTAVSTS